MKSLLSIFFALLSSSLIGQTLITGHISDNKELPLTGANIYIEGTYEGTSSDIKGNYTLNTSEEGEHILCIEFLGFEKQRISITLNGKTIQKSIQLKESFNELTAVTISAGTFEAGDNKKSIQVNSLDMVTTPSSSGDIYGALQALPGTTTIGESGKLFVKGGDSRESKTYIDGTLVHTPYTSTSPNTSVRSRFNPFMFSGTMFSMGGYSAEFGQALSSVLALSTHEKEIEDQLNISILSVGAELGGTKTWEKSSLTLTGSYNNLKPYMNIVPQNTEYTKAPQSINGEASYRLQTPKSGLLKFYTNISQSKTATLEQDLSKNDETIPYELCNNNAFLNTSWKGEIKKNWTLYSGLSHTYNANLVNSDTIRYGECLNGTHTKFLIKHRINKRIKIIGGGELNNQTYAISFKNALSEYETDYTGNTISTFIESEMHASQNFISRIGARYEYDTYLKKANVAPRFSVAYKVNTKNQVSFSYGWFFQNPDDEYLLYTNNLNYERADHYTVNYIHSGKNRILRSELYYKNYQNLLKYNTNEQSSNNYINNEGYGSTYGLDLFWRDSESIKFLEYWVSYSYINSKRNYLNYPNESTPNFASKHNLNVVLKYWLGPLRSLVGLSYKYASPRSYNNPNSSVFNNEQTRAYQSLDANWSYLHRQNIIFHFSVSNILGYKNQYGYRYAKTADENDHFNSAPILPGAKRFFVLGCFITLSKKGNLNQMDQIN